MANVEIVDKAVEQSSVLVSKIDSIREELIDQLKAIKSDYENSKRVNKLVKQDIERYFNAMAQMSPETNTPERVSFLKRCSEKAKTKRNHEVLLKIVDKCDSSSLAELKQEDFKIVLGINLCRFDDEQVTKISSAIAEIVTKAVNICELCVEVGTETFKKLEDEGNIDRHVVDQLEHIFMNLVNTTLVLEQTNKFSLDEHYGQLYTFSSVYLTDLVNTFITIYAGIHYMHECFAKLINNGADALTKI